MTTIKRLSIQGVRSYSDREPEVIEFFRPLTIIVGANGSGKTTIIEALKFVCTGSQPPLSDNGKSFVHDPKIVGKELVKGQIKLNFNTRDDKPVLAIRSFQLTQKKTKREFKQLETILRSVDSQGKVVSTSHRCSDMEKQLPQLMGVSKAVLENVIFCHQEDSAWPLSESKVLKQKFDDIFAATRFTKAVDVIGKIRKEQGSQIKLLEADLKILENNLESAQKLEDDLDNTRKKIEFKDTKIKQIEAEVQVIEKTLGKLTSHSKEINTIKADVRKMKDQIAFMEGEMKLAFERIQTEFDDSDDDLRTIFQRFQNEMHKLGDDMAAQKRQEDNLKRKLLEKQGSYESRMKTFGKYEGQAQENEAKKADLTRLQQRLTAKFSMNNLPSAISCVQFREALVELESSRRRKQTSHRAQAEQADAEFELKLTSLKKSETENRQRLGANQEAAEKNNNRLVNVSRGIKECTANMAEHHDIAATLDSAEADFQRFEAAGADLKIKHEMAAAKSEMQLCTTRIDGLQTEHKTMAFQQQQLSQLQFSKTSISKICAEHNTRLAEVVSSLPGLNVDLKHAPLPIPAAWDDALQLVDSNRPGDRYYSAGVQEEIQTAVGQAKEASKKREKHLEAIKADSFAVKGQLDQLVQSSQKKRKAVHGYQEKFRNAGLNGDLRQEMDACQKRVEKYQKKITMAKSASLLYSKFIHEAEEKHTCLVCCRDLTSTERGTFLEMNRAKLRKLENPESQAGYKRELRAAESRLDEMERLKTAWSEFERLQAELATADLKQAELQGRHQEAVSRRQEAGQKLATVKSQEEALVRDLHKGADVARMYHDIQSKMIDVRGQILRLEETAVDGRTLEVLERELKGAEQEKRRHHERLDQASTKLEDCTVQKQDLMAKVHQLRQQATKVQHWQLQRERFQQDQKELQASVEQDQNEGRRLARELEPLKHQLQQVAESRQRVRLQHKQEDAKLAGVVEAVRNELMRFRTILEEVDRFAAEAPQRAQTMSAIEDLKRGLEEIRLAHEQLTTDRQRKEKKLTERAKVETDIRANLEYRSRKKKRNGNIARMEELQRQVAEKAQGEDVSIHIESLQKDAAQLSTAKSELRGALITEKQQANSFEIDLDTDRYRDIDNRHRQKQIEVRTTQLANKDLETYGKALDEALMRFHMSKMKEINNILREYWRSTYRGKDIDEVYILSECTTSTGGKRTYNYRVVMKQGDTELSMRGRCSAGQKVLASLLIRLALAETFCLQCGVLALDEPTTNLDEANIKSFAKALNAIIEKRRGQRNFQLILITHDDQFVEKIGQRAHADHYFRVYKDINQHSKIRKQQLYS